MMMEDKFPSKNIKINFLVEYKNIFVFDFLSYISENTFVRICQKIRCSSTFVKATQLNFQGWYSDLGRGKN